VAAVSFLVTPYAVMMPLFASEIYGADARAYGLLIGSAGAGALGAGLYLASRQGTERLPRRVADAVLLASAALTAVFAQHAAGGRLRHCHGDGFRRDRLHRRQQYAGADAGRRCLSRPRHGHFSMAFLGIAPLGSFTVGHLAQWVGVQPVLFSPAVLASLVVGVVGRRRLAIAVSGATVPAASRDPAGRRSHTRRRPHGAAVVDECGIGPGASA
jgi:hypothetical protein